MKRAILLAIMGMILGGCGDTIYQTSAPTANKLAIKSVSYGLYSTHGSVFDRYSSNGLILEHTVIYPRWWMEGSIEYSGDPQGVIISIDTPAAMHFAAYTLMPSNILRIFYYMEQEDMRTLVGMPLTFTLTDPHGNDSNRFLVPAP